MSSYPDSRPLFPLALASLKPGLQQLVADPKGHGFYVIGKEKGGSMLQRYDADSGITTPIIASKGLGNGIGYGGHCYDVYDGQIIMAMADGAIGRLGEDGITVKPITPRYDAVAAPKFCGKDGRHILFVARQGERQQVLITDGDSQPVPLTDPTWFAFDPVLSPDGQHLAWQSWRSHEMPFISATIEIAAIDWQQGDSQSGQPRARHLHSLSHPLPSGERASLAYPQFGPGSDSIAYCSDHEGRRQIYIAPLTKPTKPEVIAIEDGEVGDAPWVYGQQPFRFLSHDQIIWRHSRGLCDRMVLSGISAKDAPHQELMADGSAIAELAVSQNRWAVIAERTDQEPQLYLGSASHGSKDSPCAQPRPVMTSKRGGYKRDILQRAEHLTVTFNGKLESEALFLPPRRGPGQGKYPLIVVIHGGPTARITERFRGDWQFLASRGIGILGINHRGSTGHGREFQDLLAGTWGEVDAEDAKAAAKQALAANDQLDPERVFIMGGSAGGYTTLRALCVDREFWAGGICLYGIADLIKLADTTHPFERPYNAYLLGHDDGTTWQERSPAFYEPAISSPLLIFHGRKDKAVPIGPMEDFYGTLRASGNRDVELVIFDDEGHGFRRGESITRVLEETLAFVKGTSRD